MRLSPSEILKEAAGAAKKGPSEAVAIMRPWYVSLNINATRPRSREFIEFLKLLDAAYPAHTAIKAMDFFNREPVVHTWTHKLDRAA